MCGNVIVYYVRKGVELPEIDLRPKWSNISLLTYSCTPDRLCIQMAIWPGFVRIAEDAQHL